MHILKIRKMEDQTPKLIVNNDSDELIFGDTDD